MRKRLIILGAGGSALDALDVVDALNACGDCWEVAGFLDDGQQAGEAHMGLPVLGPLSMATQFPECVFINTIGSDRSYKMLAAILAATRLERDRFVTLAHPRASVSSRAKLGVGICVNYGVSIGGRVAIGDQVYIGPGVIIGHDSVIGDHSIVAPGAVISSSVNVGESCYVGAGATIRQHIRVGARSLIGMGAVVVRDVKADATVVGNPATAR